MLFESSMVILNLIMWIMMMTEHHFVCVVMSAGPNVLVVNVLPIIILCLLSDDW